MEFPQGLSILSAVGGSVVISLGLVLQKKGVAWLSWKAPKDARFRRLRLTWFVGFGLNNLLSVFYYFALKALTASVVGAMMGLNILFSAVFAAMLLKEPIAKRVAFGSLAMVLFIVLANTSAPPYHAPGSPSPFLIGVFFTLPYLIVGLAGLARWKKRMSDHWYALAFAAAAGSLEGFVIVLMKAMQAAEGGDVLRYFLTPYLYMYVVASLSLITFLQVAYAHGRMTSTGPVLWGMQIIYPVALTYIAFEVQGVPLQIFAFAGIVVCVAVIQSKR